MWARDAYPNGDAREEVTATATSGKNTAFDGKTDGILAPLGQDRKRYESPVRTAKRD